MKGLISTVLLLIPLGAAQCCSLVSQPLPAQYQAKQVAFARLKFKEFYDDADVVYETTVLRIEDHPGDRRTSNFVRVDYVWKKDGGQIEELIAGHGGGDCSIGFTLGGSQVVFAKRVSNDLRAKGGAGDPLYAMSTYFAFSPFHDDVFQTAIHQLLDFSQLRSESSFREFLKSLSDEPTAQ